MKKIICLLLLFTSTISYSQTSYDYFNRGLAKIELGDYRGAITDFTKVIELKPKDIFAYDIRGSAKIELGDYRGAINDYSKAMQLDPNEQRYLVRGIYKSKLGDKRGAITDYSKATELVHNKIRCLARGIFKYKIGDYLGAINDYSKAIELDPKFADAYYNRGLAKLGLSKKESGCLDLSKAGELGYAEAYEMIKKYCN